MRIVRNTAVGCALVAALVVLAGGCSEKDSRGAKPAFEEDAGSAETAADDRMSPRQAPDAGPVVRDEAAGRRIEHGPGFVAEDTSKARPRPSRTESVSAKHPAAGEPVVVDSLQEEGEDEKKEKLRQLASRLPPTQAAARAGDKTVEKPAERAEPGKDAGVPAAPMRPQAKAERERAAKEKASAEASSKRATEADRKRRLQAELRRADRVAGDGEPAEALRLHTKGRESKDARDGAGPRKRVAATIRRPPKAGEIEDGRPSINGVAVRPKWGRGGRRTGRRTWQDAIAGEELWVIARPGKKSAVPEVKDYPGQGELRAKLPGRDKEIPLPLKHTDVKAQVAAFVATVNVTQQYHNPYGEKIEAVYVFPLPQDAAVTEFVMTIGDRHIRGIIREREEAERIYKAAKKQGYVASLLTQERPNIFTQRIANIEPKKRIDVTITYFNTLKYSKGEYEFVFPMVVGPRFNPPGFTDGVGAVGRGRPGRSGQETEVQYLKPGERSGHDISVSVDIDAGIEIEEAKSPSHAVDVKRRGPSRMSVKLSPNDTIPNKDLVLRYRVAGKQLKTALMTHRGKTGNYFALVLQPPGSLADCPRTPREMVFVLDCSGSMSGWPMAKSKEAMRRALKKLDADDTFQVIRFSSNASKLGSDPVPATPRNVKRALRFVDKLSGSGGTMMIEGIKAALDFPHDAKRFRVVSFLTDGYIGNENRILGAIHEKLGAARIFSFGVGSSPNRFLLEGMARLGRGAVAFITLNEAATDAVDLFYERASRPALTDVEIDWGALKVSDVYPRRMPDLFVGRPVLITGKFEGDGPARIRVTGRMGYEDTAFEVAGDLDAKETRHNGIAKIWARRKLGHLADLGTHEPSSELTEEMIATSLEYSVQCKHTAFVAVDSSRRTEGTHGTTVGVAVPVPDGVRYETTVEE